MIAAHAHTRAYTYVVVESSSFREVSDQSRLCLVRCEKVLSVPRALPLSIILSSRPGIYRARGGSPRDRVNTWTERGSEERGRKIDRRVSPPVEHHYGSSVLRDHRDGVPGLRGSGPPRRRPGSAESPADRGALRAQQLLLRVCPEGHLAAHAQDRRRMDVGGKRLLPVHVEMYVAIGRRIARLNPIISA